MIGAGTRVHAQAARHLGTLHDHCAQVRQQPFHADLMLA